MILPLLAAWLWRNCLTSLSLILLLCNMGNCLTEFNEVVQVEHVALGQLGALGWKRAWRIGGLDESGQVKSWGVASAYQGALSLNTQSAPKKPQRGSHQASQRSTLWHPQIPKPQISIAFIAQAHTGSDSASSVLGDWARKLFRWGSSSGLSLCSSALYWRILMKHP